MRHFVFNGELVRWWLKRAETLLTVAVFVALLAGRAPADTLEIRVADGNDDAEEHLNEGNSIDLTSSDLEIGAEGGGDDAQLIGMRFLDIDIPRGARVNSASIQFTVDETDDEEQSMPIQIFGQLGEALTFTDTPGDISSRQRTGAFVNWENIPPWPNVGDDGPDQQTPDISRVIQSIINQGNWAPNNALVIMMTGLEQFERTAESFNGDASAAALLTIDFDPADILMFGDFNEDGAVDTADYQIMVGNFNSPGEFADGDNDFSGFIDLADYVEFRAIFNSQAQAAAVPEPTSAGLGVLASWALACAVRRRR